MGVERHPTYQSGRVLVWTTAVLPASETFIRNQFNGLHSWTGILAGAYRVHSPLSRDTDAAVFGDDKFSQLRLRTVSLTGRSARITKLLREWRPDVVHAHFITGAWLILKSTEQVGVPLVVTAHGSDVTRWPASKGLRGLRARHQIRKVLHRATLVIAVSEPIKKRVIELGASPSRVVVHHIGIPLADRERRLTERKWDVAFVGRFTEKKGVLDLISALAIVAAAMPVKAVFVGDGPLMADARLLAEKSQADIVFMGVQPPSRVREVLAQSTMLAAPSKTAADGDSEGLPTVILEAAAASLPVVGTLHSGIPEGTVDGLSGLLSPEGDPARLASNIMTLLSDPNAAEEMGRQGRQKVERDFDLAKQTHILEDLYASALKLQGEH